MRIFTLPAVLAALISASCAPSTPEARIAARPEVFASLPAKQQEMVRQGHIDTGMGTDAVYFAWGRPSRVYEGGDEGAATLRWDYLGSSPVYGTNFYGGYGRYGRYGSYPYYGVGLGPEIAYVPYRRATVQFLNGRVRSWERTR